MRLPTNIVLILLTIITNYRMQKIHMYNTTKMYLQEITDYPILFKVMGAENFKFYIPDECKERNICEQIPIYLQEYITEIISMLSTKNIILYGVEDVEDTLKFNTQNNIDTQYEDLCSTKKKRYFSDAATDRHTKNLGTIRSASVSIIMTILIRFFKKLLKFFIPKAAADINNTWHIILNDNQHPQYKFRVEICKINNSSCSNAYFPPDYTSKCIQKFTLHSMVALNEENEVVQRLFPVPSCCSCGVKNV